jgi:hypothetical protein
MVNQFPAGSLTSCREYSPSRRILRDHLKHETIVSGRGFGKGIASVWCSRLQEKKRTTDEADRGET